MKQSLSIFLFLISYVSYSQVNEIVLDPNGIAFPRMNTSQRNALSPAQGDCIYNTQSNSLECFNGTSWSGPSTGAASALNDNDGDTYISVEQSADEDVIRFSTQGIEIMRHDGQTLHITNSGQSVFIGENAGVGDDLTNNRNTFVGSLSGQANTTGTQNVAVGHQALKDNISGSSNIALGQQALQKNKNSNNVAIGYNAARDNNNGNKNIAIGGFSGFTNQNGIENTFIGYEAGRNTSTTTTGSVMLGHQAGMNETSNNRLYIANDNTTTPLIYGEFDNQKVVTNGDHQITGEAKITTMNTASATAQAVAREADGTLSVIPASTSPTYAVGDYAHGGVVFWVSSDGKHGKVANIFDVKEVLWSNISNVEIGESADSYNHGASNTIAIMMQDGHTASAAKLCADLAYAGYDDWYLPSWGELSLMRTLRTTIDPTAVAHGGGSFKNEDYWTSNEVDINPGLAWTVDFNTTGGSSGTSKYLLKNVRPIRSF